MLLSEILKGSVVSDNFLMLQAILDHDQALFNFEGVKMTQPLKSCYMKSFLNLTSFCCLDIPVFLSSLFKKSRTYAYHSHIARFTSYYVVNIYLKINL